MPTPFRISAKTLGEIALEKFCPRCFWRKLHVSKLPYQIFPGIFSSIDAYTKRVVHSTFDHGRAPAYLAELGDVIGYAPAPHSSRFNIHDEANDILLTGTPDEILLRRDQSYIIVDYKTARFTPAADSLFPLYEAQLNVYALIAAQVGPNPISALALIYMEPQTDNDATNDENNHHAAGFAMKFSAHILRVEIKPALIPPLLKRAREIFDATAPPASRDGCTDCKLFEALVALG
ncbi:MAG: PD-(D/E)XK nuclease family protein [Chloroflexi bacterium]|nr:PD-(D/E)XK nuclease family protein [Chloroflexota bacterium]